ALRQMRETAHNNRHIDDAGTLLGRMVFGEPTGTIMRMTNREALLALPTQILRIALNWSRDQRRLLAAAMDGVLCVIAVWIAYSLRLGVWELASRPVLTFAAATLLFW